MAARFDGENAAHVGCALRAQVTAESTSASPAIPTWAWTSPVVA
jgi:hypothetical protein